MSVTLLLFQIQSYHVYEYPVRRVWYGETHLTLICQILLETSKSGACVTVILFLISFVVEPSTGPWKSSGWSWGTHVPHLMEYFRIQNSRDKAFLLLTTSISVGACSRYCFNNS